MRHIRLIDSGQPTRWLLLLVVFASMALASYPLFFSPPSAYGIEGGCADADASVDFNGDGVASYSVPDVESGQVITAVCIGFGIEDHSEPLSNDDDVEEGGCLSSEGVGGPSVIVQAIGECIRHYHFFTSVCFQVIPSFRM